MAVECKQIHDTCARCAKMHRTAQCDALPSEYHCSNCNKHGHAASDRACPAFIHECAKLLKRYPENKYCYFPTKEDPTSWELVEGAEGNSQPQADGQQQEPNGNTGEWRTIRSTQRGTMAGPGWTGGARGGRTTGSRAGRGTFTPMTRDNGWNGRTTETGPEATQPGTSSRATNATPGPPTAHPASQRQSTLDRFMQANPSPSS
jgi:hypothetical protein